MVWYALHIPADTPAPKQRRAERPAKPREFKSDQGTEKGTEYVEYDFVTLLKTETDRFHFHPAEKRIKRGPLFPLRQNNPTCYAVLSLTVTH